MKPSRPVWLLFSLFVVVASLSGCALGTQLQSVTTDPRTITGTYDLYTYGCRYPDDIEHAAFLITPDKAGMVELYVPATSYKIKRGLPTDQAIAEANTHIRCGVRTVEETRVHRIPDGSGGTLGYEFLPRYPYTDEGGKDPLLVTYSQKEDGKIVIYINLHPNVERLLYRGSPSGGQ
jgi:hypothetical protein